MAPQNWSIYIYISIYITCLKQIGIQGSHETKLHSEVVSNTGRLRFPTSSVCILLFHLLISRWLQILRVVASSFGFGWNVLKLHGPTRCSKSSSRCLEAIGKWVAPSWKILQVEVIGSVEIIFDCGNYTPDLWKTQLILVSSAIFHGVSPVFHGVSSLYSVIFLSTTLPRCLPANLRLV